MAKKTKGKQNFVVMENETIDQCLDRMKSEGYIPIRRMEEPIFQEVEKNGKKEVEPCGRKIVFEGRLMNPEG
ncbi:NETI motif-containing protein [Sutcliffiella cohnii]